MTASNSWPARLWPSNRWAAVCLVLFAAGAAIRVNNAIQYPVNLGFDAPENWRYIHDLIHSWTLPVPDAHWAASHPPLFYYASAAVGRLIGFHAADPVVIIIRLLSSALGLLAIGLAVALVRHAAPDRPRRAWLAGGLLLFLPAHIYLSAMLSEEILTSTFVSVVVVGTAWELMRSGDEGNGDSRAALWRAAALGFVGGLAFMTKLSGSLVVMACALAVLIAGWRRDRLWQSVRWAAVLSSVALVVGGWYYAHNWITYGYIYPQDLLVHEVMFTMPPGDRGISDYWYLPLATWLDPQLLAPDLLHSVWGSTYATLWFDGHRHFLARESEMVTRAGTLILLLALLPVAAFATGLIGGIRRSLERATGADGPLVWLVGFTIAGYVAFTWGNPWFAAIKGSYLLGLSVPFAFYTSEVLDRWASGGRLRQVLVWGTLVALMLAVAVVFTYGPVYWNWAGRGIKWIPIEAP